MKYRRLRDQILDDIESGADPDDYTLEADECITWCDEEDPGQMFAYHFVEAVNELWRMPEDPRARALKVKVRDRFEALTRKVMEGNMTVEELCEWRDIQRAAVIDYISNWARVEIARELPI